jgi:hypothetical protein
MIQILTLELDEGARVVIAFAGAAARVWGGLAGLSYESCDVSPLWPDA